MGTVNSNRSTLIAWILAILSYSLLVVPQRYIPIWGDDFLLLRASGAYQGFGSSADISFSQTGMEKYRPVFLVMFAVLHHFFEENLTAYLIINSVLVLPLGVVFGIVLRETTQLKNIAIPAGIVLVSSMRFLWSSREWIFGLMEIVALISCLLAIYFYLKSIRKMQCRYCILLANIFLLVSIFTAERYAYVGIIFAIYFAFLRRGYNVPITAARIAAPAIIVLFNFAVKILVFQVSPLQGSLINYQEVNKSNLLINVSENLLLSTARIFGFSVYPTDNPYGTFLRIASLLILGVLFYPTCARYVSRKPASRVNVRSGLPRNHNSSNLLFAGIGVSGVLVISLEPYRVEAWDERFLVLSQLMVFILAINLAPRIFSYTLSFNPYLPVIIFLLVIEWSYLPQREYRFPLQNKVIGMYEVLDPYLKGSQEWRLVLDIPPSLEGDVNWALGYPYVHFVGVFSKSQNPPRSITPISSLSESGKIDMKCVVAKLDEVSTETTLTAC